MFDYHYFIILFFILGYTLLIVEHQLKINKAAIALMTGTLLWVIYLQWDPSPLQEKYTHLSHHLSDITEVLLFLIGAMTIVELISSHQGFESIRKWIMISSPRKLFWVLAVLGFFMSSVLDNLTTILVLVSLIRQTVEDVKMRRVLCAGLVFIVNAGGAWTPIGDITTTMLWIEGRVNTGTLMADLALPSIMAFLLFSTLYSLTIPKPKIHLYPKKSTEAVAGSTLVLWLGIAGLLAVPMMKLAWDLPPFIGILLSLGFIWIITDRFHRKKEERKTLKIEYILTKIDISCVMFFLGILLAVGCLETTGILDWIAQESRQVVSNPYLFTMMIGIFSALVDNVPLVAGMIKMFDVSTYPPDHIFWSLTAYCAGIGGSLLIIGSAPGVALMSLKDIPFVWYLKKVSWIALIAYTFGWGLIYLLEHLNATI